MHWETSECTSCPQLSARSDSTELMETLNSLWKVCLTARLLDRFHASKPAVESRGVKGGSARSGDRLSDGRREDLHQEATELSLSSFSTDPPWSREKVHEEVKQEEHEPISCEIETPVLAPPPRANRSSNLRLSSYRRQYNSLSSVRPLVVLPNMGGVTPDQNSLE
ncbi:unnamed protein product [Pleuronectes platessa]|uniref:Uncharacterized protein n=1 Tax=Pleuronectes platessa TaxID=8262 RepID=A0A9N7YWJ4_PLEPL|nr:unnamed protein product [Pleuronectes platessa]